MLESDLSLDFESIFKNTENNISSIRRQLSNKGKNHVAPRSPIESNYFSSSPRADMLNKLHSSYSSPSSSQTTLITSVFKRLEEQSKTISLLESIIQTQNDDIQQLKDKQGNLEDILRATNSCYLQRKIESIESKIGEEISSLWSAVRGESHSRSDRQLDISAREQLSRELQREIIEDELESLRREVENLKSRIVRIENDVTGSLREAVDINRKYIAIEREVGDIRSNQRNMRRASNVNETQLQDVKRELEDITSILSDVYHKNTTKNGSRELEDISSILSDVYHKNTTKNDPRKSNHRTEDYSDQDWENSDNLIEVVSNIADSPTLTQPSSIAIGNDNGAQDLLLSDDSLKLDITNEEEDPLFELDNSSNLSLEGLQLSDNELLSALDFS